MPSPSKNSPLRIWEYRGLIYHLAQRELKARHKKSILGWLWSLINPAATLGIYTLVFGYFLKVQPPIAGNGELKSFALYLFSALVTWNCFNSIVMGSMLAFQTSGGMLTKVYFPPECPAIANMLVALVQLGIELTILISLFAIFDNISWNVLWVPLIVVQLVLFSIGVGLVVSLWNIRYRDVSYLIGIALQMLFYATPIVYNEAIIPEKMGRVPIRFIFHLNPLTQFVGDMRKCLYMLQSPSWISMAVMTGVSFAVAGFGWLIFSRSAPGVIEEL